MRAPTVTDLGDTLLKARIYDALHRGNPGDLGFYVEACQGVGSVLELGCGSGRVLGALVDGGIERLVGLDRDGEHLALSRERFGDSVTLVEADMRRFDVAGPPFERIIIPYNGLYTLPGDEDVVACLACAARHLAPQGQLLFDAYAVDDEDIRSLGEIGEGEPDPFEYVATLWLDDGAQVTVWEREAPLAGRRRMSVEYRYDVEAEGQTRQLEAQIAHHFLSRDDVKSLVRRAGLELLALHGGFAGEPFVDESEHYVVTAKLTSR